MADAPLRFGVNYLPNAAEDTLRWAQVAEEVGLDIVGIADSQSLYRDVYMCLALCAAETSRVRLGPRGYHADQHDMPDSDNRALIHELGLVDYLAERFSVAGTVGDCAAKLEGAIDAGARQFWMSIHFDDKERFLRKWGAVMERFR